MKACAGRLQIRDRPKIISNDEFPVDPGTPPGLRPGFRPGKTAKASPAKRGKWPSPALGRVRSKGASPCALPRSAALRTAPLSPRRGQLPRKRGEPLGQAPPLPHRGEGRVRGGRAAATSCNSKKNWALSKKIADGQRGAGALRGFRENLVAGTHLVPKCQTAGGHYVVRARITAHRAMHFTGIYIRVQGA